MLFYCGSYTESSQDKGISLGYLDPHTGGLRITRSFFSGPNPSYLLYNKKQGLLYGINETGDADSGGLVSTLKVGQEGFLTLQHQQKIPGWGSCQGVLHPGGGYLFTADYSSGSISRVDLDPQGQPVKASLLVQHRGSGSDPERQEAPHIHSLVIFRKSLIAVDLGLDMVTFYPADPMVRPYEAKDQWTFPGGSGPRWVHPLGEDRYYVVSELSSRIHSWVLMDDNWVNLQGLSTLPADWEGENYPAHLEYSARHRILYLSNRGHDSIASFYVDPDTGLMEYRGFCSLEKARFPRYFSLSPCGNYLLVAGQKGHCLESLRLDEKGLPHPTGEFVETPSPSSVLFLKV